MRKACQGNPNPLGALLTAQPVERIMYRESAFRDALEQIDSEEDVHSSPVAYRMWLIAHEALETR